jgi:hypothetical protein
MAVEVEGQRASYHQAVLFGRGDVDCDIARQFYLVVAARSRYGRFQIGFIINFYCPDAAYCKK